MTTEEKKQRKILEQQEKEFFEKRGYFCGHYTEYDYKNLKHLSKKWKNDAAKDRKVSLCGAWIMLDTETSKGDIVISEDRKKANATITTENKVVAFSIAFRDYHRNICCLYGNKPSEIIECIEKVKANIHSEILYIYVQNLSYDWTFLRKFFIKVWGEPVKQLNTKSHFPIYIEFENGIIFRDSLIISQRKLEKWGKDLDAEHKKAVGKWNYDKTRTQKETYTSDEILYMCNDVLCGVECLDRYSETIKRSIERFPWTATGVPRSQCQTLARKNGGHDLFQKLVADTYMEQNILEHVFHGGYTHANRDIINCTINDEIICYDFASSYPFCMLAKKFPMEKFTKIKNCSKEDILTDTENAFYFKLIGVNVTLKNPDFPMPALQCSKALKLINPVEDNGRILECDYIEIMLTEQDLYVIDKQYEFKKHICINVHAAKKGYLPRWFTDYVFSLFQDKTKLKGEDLVLYGIAKGLLNACYGMIVQKPVKDEIYEDYITGEYKKREDIDKEELYTKYIKKKNSIFPYQWGVWVTAYAFRNLFELGECCKFWLYSDTDSCYGIGWDKDKLDSYNAKCKQALLNNGYGPAVKNGREYWLGVAEQDGIYSQFRTVGAKRYSLRTWTSNTKVINGRTYHKLGYMGKTMPLGKLKITVAGVPKNGAECLKDDIENFKDGFVFSGTMTGKKTHTYITRDIHTDSAGDEVGDSIDLTSCDYLLSSIKKIDDLFKEEIEVNYYE